MNMKYKNMQPHSHTKNITVAIKQKLDMDDCCKFINGQRLQTDNIAWIWTEQCNKLVIS